MKKSYADFIATRRETDDIAATLSLDPLYFGDFASAEHKQPGFIYDDSFYIERRPDGAFFLMILRDGYRAEDLESLEHRLWDWARAEFPDDYAGLSRAERINRAWQALEIQCEHRNLDPLSTEQTAALGDDAQWPGMLDDMEARCGMDVSEARALLGG